MKNQLFSISSLLALSVPVALLTIAPNAQAAGLVLGSTATTNMIVSNANPLSIVTNQSGLSATYTSGTTDFDSYVSSTTANSSSASSFTNNWFSRSPSRTGFVTFDLGASYDVNALALWAARSGQTSAIRNFSLYADTDTNTSSLGTLLGNFSAIDAVGGDATVRSQIFNFATTNTRYIQMNITSNAGGSVSGFNEVAFRGSASAAAVPEPLTIGAATAAAFGAAFKRRKSQD